jgi:hypothetical protein
MIPLFLYLAFTAPPCAIPGPQGIPGEVQRH